MGKEMTRERLDGVGFPTHQISYRLLTRQKVASSDGLRPFRNMKSYHIMYHPTYMSVFVLFQSALELLIHPDYYAQKIIELLLSSKTYRGGPYNLRGT